MAKEKPTALRVALRVITLMLTLAALVAGYLAATRDNPNAELWDIVLAAGGFALLPFILFLALFVNKTV